MHEPFTLERSSAMWSLKAMERSQVCILMIDGEEGLTDQDIKIASQ